MKICHVTSAHQRYDGRIFRKECCTLAKAGNLCFLVVNDNLPDEKKQGVNIVSTGLEVKSRKDRFFKSHSLIIDKIKLIDADIYHFHDPDLLSVANRVKHWGKKVIFDFHENVSEQIMDKYWIPKIARKFVRGVYDIYETTSARKYDYLITVTPRLVEKLKGKNQKIEMITNFPIVDNSHSMPAFNNHNICFAGGISTQWCHENILDAIKDIDECNYLLAGGVEDDYLEVLKRKEGWEKVTYLGVVAFEKVKNIYETSTIGMALNISTQIGKEGSLGNTKLFEYMLAGIPVICSDNVLWKSIVEENNCGIAVDPHDVNEIRKAIIFLIENRDIAVQMGKKGREAALEKYNWSIEAEKLISLYDRMK